MSDKLHVVEAGGLALPTHVAKAKETRAHTLVPCVFTSGRVPKMDDVKECFLTRRNYHRTMHVMAKGAERPLCQCKPPQGYSQLYGLTQSENQGLMETDRQSPWWHRLMWCGSCTTWAGILVRRAS